MELSMLIEHTKNAIEKTYQNKTKLTREIFLIDGMNGNRNRILYNNICELPNSTYLEVGSWIGASFISALYKNETTIGYSIENWKEFFGPKEEFMENINMYLNNRTNINIIEKDCWKLSKEEILNPIDIYLYDGEHSYQAHKNAICHYHSFFSKYVIIMIDDWMCYWADVKSGTMDGIKEMNLKVHFSFEIPLINTTTYHTGGDTFWNGCGIFVCERTDI